MIRAIALGCAFTLLGSAALLAAMGHNVWRMPGAWAVVALLAAIDVARRWRRAA